jgi:hypothetical protein
VEPVDVNRSIRLLATGEILLRDLEELDDPAIAPLCDGLRELCVRLRQELSLIRPPSEGD